MSPQGAAPKKDRLTLTQLAGYDDILTDALVDHVYFWTTIRKNRSKYNLTRGINQDDVTRIILHDLIVAKDLQKTETSLLELPGLRKFYSNLKTDKEKENFKKHMRKYINIWNTDCPFEVSTTNRYTIVTQEAAVTARRYIKKGDVVKYLCGNKVPMTPEEESDLDLTRRDFSIVVSSRKKIPSLFLGPARFANHDCNANARLVTRGSDGMEVVAIRDILQGDEITVTYGDHYFGENNCECLCLSCEKAGQGAWPAQAQSRNASGTATPFDTETSGHYSLRSSRREASRSTPDSISKTPDFLELPSPKRRKKNVAAAPTLIEDEKSINEPVNTRRVSTRNKSGLRHELEPSHEALQPARRGRTRLSSNNPTSQPPGDVLLKEEDELVTKLKAALNNAKAKNLKVKGKRSFDEISQLTLGEAAGAQIPATTLVAKSIGVQMRTLIDVPETPRTPSNPVLAAPKSSKEDVQSLASVSNRTSPYSAPRTSTPLTTISTSGTPSPPKLGVSLVDDANHDLSDLSPTADFDEFGKGIINKAKSTFLRPPPNRRHKDSPSLLPTIETPATSADVKVGTTLPSARSPGDYVRTPLLLGEKYSRWVDCHTCSNTWVQANGYLTRKECPRCERHSMLYGYQWPKADKAGKGDENRVMDHRTVHRFLTTEQEKAVQKRGRGLIAPKVDEEKVGGSEDEDGDGDSEDEKEVEEPPKRRLRRATAKAKEIRVEAKRQGIAKEKGYRKGKVTVPDDKNVKKTNRGRPPKYPSALSKNTSKSLSKTQSITFSKARTVAKSRTSSRLRTK